jgi:hypothetical protein
MIMTDKPVAAADSTAKEPRKAKVSEKSSEAEVNPAVADDEIVQDGDSEEPTAGSEEKAEAEPIEAVAPSTEPKTSRGSPAKESAKEPAKESAKEPAKESAKEWVAAGKSVAEKMRFKRRIRRRVR